MSYLFLCRLHKFKLLRPVLFPNWLCFYVRWVLNDLLSFTNKGLITETCVYPIALFLSDIKRCINFSYMLKSLMFLSVLRYEVNFVHLSDLSLYWPKSEMFNFLH